MNRSVLLFCAVLFWGMIVASISEAQSNERNVGALPVSEDRAIELALQNRTDMQIQKMQIDVKERELNIAKGSLLPRLDFLIEAQHLHLYDAFSGYIVSVNIAGTPFTAKVDQAPLNYQIDSALQFRYNLYAGGRDTAAIEEARANKNAAEYEMQATRRRVILDTVTAYWELRKAQIQFGAAERWKDYYWTALQITETQLNKGDASELEKKTAALQYKEQEMAVQEAKRKVMYRLNKYHQALGLGTNEISADEHHIPVLTEDPDREINLPGVDQQQPELRKIEAEIQAAKARMKYERAKFLPTLEVFSTYRNIGRDFDSFDAAWRDFHRWDLVVGIELRFNIFDGFKTWNRTKEAALSAELQRLYRKQKEEDIEKLLSEKSLNVDRAKDDLALAQQRLEVSEAREKISRVRLQAGQYSKQEYAKDLNMVKEDADKVLMGKIDIKLAQFNYLLQSLN